MMEEDNSETKQSLLTDRSKTTTSIERYRKKLLAQVVTIFLICLIVILERVFYQIIVDAEETTLANLQSTLGLVVVKEDITIPKSITLAFYKFMGELSQFQYQFLFLTHILATMYVAFDALLTAKVCYVTFGMLYLISVIQMFYSGPRPFWYRDQVLSSACLPSYNHPSLGLILMIFVPFYGYECWRKKPNSKLGD